MTRPTITGRALDEAIAEVLAGTTSSHEFRITPDVAARLETGYWRAWVMTFFGPGTSTNLSAGFARHHKRVWKWGWTIKKGVYKPPIIFLVNRRGAKSSTLEMLYAMMGARELRSLMVNTSMTVDQAQEHLGNIQTLLETPEIQAGYPKLGARLVNQYGSSRGWSTEQLVTELGPAYMMLSLEKAARGLKKHNVRPDFEGFDDIDEDGDSPYVTKKKAHRIANKIIGAGAEEMTGMFCQNVITSTSIANQFAEGIDYPFFTDAEVIGPIPAAYDLSVEVNDAYEPGKGGSKKWLVKSCKPTWVGFNAEAIEREINRLTLPVFNIECQHEVHQNVEGAILDEWDEVYHVIEYREFARVFPDFFVKDEATGRLILRVPAKCQKVMGGDEGTTFEHPSVFGWYFSAPEPEYGKEDLRGWFFRYREYWTPKLGIDPSPARVSYLRVGQTLIDIETQVGEWGEIKKRVLSADAKGMRDLFYEELKLVTETPNSTYTSGIAEMKAYLGLRKKENPFVVYPKGYCDPVTLEDLSGKKLPFSPRFACLVPDGSATLMRGPTGKLIRSGPRGLRGIDEQDRFRWEAPRWHWDTIASGEQRKRPYAYEEDAMSECRYVFGAGYAPAAAPLKGEAKVQKTVLEANPHLTEASIRAIVNTEEQMALRVERMVLFNVEREHAKSKQQSEIPIHHRIRRRGR